jgi:hypothetical protein
VPVSLESAVPYSLGLEPARSSLSQRNKKKDADDPRESLKLGRERVELLKKYNVL